MRRACIIQRTIAVSLAFILASCSTTRYSTAGPTDWVKHHQTELIVETVVVIAGVALVVAVCAGGGCVALIPVVLLASESHYSGSPSNTQVTEVRHVDPR